MIRRVLDGVCQKLYDEFGKDYQIYTEQVEQGLKEPCFFVSAISTQMTPILCRRQTGRYMLKLGINVAFFPQQGDNVRDNIYGIGMKLVDVLEYIEADSDTVRGSNIICEFVGEGSEIIANVIVDYEFTVYKVDNKEKDVMTELKINNN